MNTPKVLPDIKELIQRADALYNDIDLLHAGNDFANASPALARARSAVSLAGGQLNAHAAAAAAKAAKAAPATEPSKVG